MENLFKNLTLEHWYKMIVLLSAIIFMLCGAGLLPALPTTTTLLVSLGCFFVGIGEWINHATEIEFLPPSAFRPSGHLTYQVRKPRLLGSLFNLLGLLLTGIGVFKLFG